MAKAYIMSDADFADLARRIELHYRKRAEDAGQEWNLSWSTAEREASIYDQFKGTWFELCRWSNEHEINLHKALNG